MHGDARNKWTQQSKTRALRAIVPTRRAMRTSLSIVLFSIFAFITGAAIGRARGGRLSAFSSIRLNAAGGLAVGISLVLIVTLIGPSQPLWWMLGAYVAFAYFGVRNLQLTGMVVLLIGMLMNLAPLIANFAVPVSERALISVGEVDEAGDPVIETIRESTDTAGSLVFLGDVVPLPIFAAVISLGDLVIAVALADIAANVMLRSKPRREDYDAFSYTDSDDERSAPLEAELSRDLPPAPLPAVSSRQPAHASSRRRPRLKALHAIQVPAHATSGKRTTDDATGEPQHAAPAPPAPTVAPPAGDDTVIVLNDDAVPQGYSTKAGDLPFSGVDNRPIIDLTSSPSEEQLLEFLRRRSEADRALATRAHEAHQGHGAHGYSPRRRSRRLTRTNPTVDA